jgi:FKBP-type peptidyl-prolyl cis-trans isomerase
MFRKVTLYTFALLGALVFNSCEKEYENIQDIDDAKIQAYIAQNNLTNIEKDPSGFYYQIIEQGTGPALENKDSVLFTFDYKSLNGGTTYYTTPEYTNNGDYLGYITKERYSLYPNQAFRIAMSELSRGGKARVIIPSYLAFGKNGFNNVPSNEIIVSDIVMLPQANQTAVDEARIVDFLSKKGLTATRHSSGVYYIVTDPGSATDIQLTSTVTIKYTGRLFTGDVFESTPDDSPDVRRLSTHIPGWQKVLTNFKKGAKVRLFVPSVLAYGSQVQSDIPANSCLDFDIQINEVTN